MVATSAMSQDKFVAFHLLVSLAWLSIVYGEATVVNVINTTHFIRDPETIMSKGGTFKLGFFSPNGSSYRYVGIWPNKPSAINVVWVANREKPLKDSSGVLKIFGGDLVIQNGENEVVWSSNITAKTGSWGPNLTAELLDSGNLVMKKNATASVRDENVLWESFQHIGDSFFSNMTIGLNSATGKNQFLTSWTSPSDPAPGRFIGILNPLTLPEVYVMLNGAPYYRSGPWNGKQFIGIPEMYMYGWSFERNSDGTQYGTLNILDDKNQENLVLRYDGQVLVLGWGYSKPDWEVYWTSHESDCDVYGICGAFGLCNKRNNPICSCLEGFEPKNPDEWKKGNWTSGCSRRNSLHQCDGTNSTDEILGTADEYVILKSMKVPANPEFASSVQSVDECKKLCMESCSCVAYAQYNYIGCMYWNRSLIDMQEFGFGGTDLYIRVARKEGKRAMKPAVIVSVVIAGTIFMGAIIICWLGTRVYAAKQQGRNKRREDGKKEEHLENLLRELAMLTFEELASATNNFHDDNKLGEGGYGPVYKGTLPGEKEIAVKRRSTASGQGLEQFMNEVLVISKLQHRNLVRLVGCCTENEEKILVYEYMPNSSLNTYIFDPLRKEILPWRKRFEIIVGIAKGLLYLHRDSRLKIIHRDLKSANVLLDKDFNAKISDFGTAKIFGMDQDQENTGRIVGTFGYMAPEYALEGIFSEKSDVYSFGVLVLEIVCGRKNSSFCRDEQTSLGLVRYAWDLWNREEITALIDFSVFDQSFAEEILKCVHIGLLCAQGRAEDRPSMPTVLVMLGNETTELPELKQPTFFDMYTTDSSQKTNSENAITISNMEGR